MKHLLSMVLLSALTAGVDCPNETAYHVDLDSTSSTFGDTVATGQCGCLGFASTVVGTDTSVLVPIIVYDNEPLRGFQLNLRNNSEGALSFNWARAGGKSADWEIWGAERTDGSATVFGFDFDGGATAAGSEGVLVEVMFDVLRRLPSRLSFHLDPEQGLMLADVDGQNVLCSYPDEENPAVYEVNWLSTAETGVAIPSRFALHQNYPNPFNPTTTFRFDLPADAEVRLAVYDVLGREIAHLAGGVHPAGVHRVKWTGQRADGSPAVSGIYYIRLVADNYSETRKLTLLR